MNARPIVATIVKVVVATVSAILWWRWGVLANILWMNAAYFSHLFHRSDLSLLFVILETVFVMWIAWEITTKIFRAVVTFRTQLSK